MLLIQARGRRHAGIGSHATLGVICGQCLQSNLWETGLRA